MIEVCGACSGMREPDGGKYGTITGTVRLLMSSDPAHAWPFKLVESVSEIVTAPPLRVTMGLTALHLSETES